MPIRFIPNAAACNLDLVLMTRPEYEALLAKAVGGEEAMPRSVADMIQAGETPLNAVLHWKGLSKKALSRLSNVDTNSISKLGRGLPIKADKKVILANAMGVPPAWLS